MGYIHLAIAIVAEVIGTTALKYSDGFTKLFPSLLVVLGYGLAFFFLSLALKYLSIGTSYAIWAGAGIVLISIIGVVLFKEKVDLVGIVGIGLIILGIVLINGFSKMGG